MPLSSSAFNFIVVANYCCGELTSTDADSRKSQDNSLGLRLFKLHLHSLVQIIANRRVIVDSPPQDDLPKPEALEAKAAFADENQLKETNEKIDNVNEAESQNNEEAADNSEDLSGDAEKVHMRLPMELDLSDLAGALLLNQNQQ